MERGRLMSCRGVLLGLDRTLRGVFRGFRPAAAGVDRIADVINVVLPVDGWSSYAWHENGSVTIPAVGSALTTMFTVLPDERVELWAMRVRRSSGDNLIDGLLVIHPAAYRAGSSVNGDMSAGKVWLADPAVQPSDIWWPESGILDRRYNAPVFLEPGSLIQLGPAGVGAASTVFDFAITLRRTKIVRAVAPV